jgi:hypothetical protein
MSRGTSGGPLPMAFHLDSTRGSGMWNRLRLHLAMRYEDPTQENSRAGQAAPQVRPGKQHRW